MLEMSGLCKSYEGPGGQVRALEDVHLSVGGGEFVAVQGPSGCGKTTLLLAAGGLLAPSGGEVLVDGENPYELSAERRARLRASKIGFVFQQFHLIPYLSVLENVLAPSLARALPDAPRRASELVSRFSLDHRSRHLPAELSTGERQRAALARALLNRPRVLLADEPTGNLDRDNSEAVLRCMSEFSREGGAVLLVTHDARVAERADRVVRLEEGRIREAGDPPRKQNVGD